MIWRLLWRINPWLLAVMVGCSSPVRVVRPEVSHGQAVIFIPRALEVKPVTVEREEFHRAMKQLASQVRQRGSPRETAEKTFQMDALSGNYLYLVRDKKLVPAGPGEPWEGTLTKDDLETAERYRLWCRDTYQFYGDCLGGALVAGRYLDMQGRYVWALSLSKSPVLEEMRQALGEMVDFRELLSTVLWTLSSMLLILALNPVAPALVAALGVGLILYVGYGPLYRLLGGWVDLMEGVRKAATFEQIREAGEGFGKVMGREAARALAMLLLAAVGQTAQGFAGKVPTLPGSAQVAMQSQGQAGISLSALGAVEQIEVSAEGVSLTLPAVAVAMTAPDSGEGGEDPCVQTHHIATVCNDKSSARGGPWTPRFRDIFARAGMSLEDPANTLPLPGHYGPHPERYHQLILDTLVDATKTCRSVVECQKSLSGALKRLAELISTPGTELNQLVTRAPPR